MRERESQPNDIPFASVQFTVQVEGAQVGFLRTPPPTFQVVNLTKDFVSITQIHFAMVAELNSSERARGRWQILRQALLQANLNKANNDVDDENNAASIHRFPGYRMLPSTVVQKRLRSAANMERLRTIHSMEDVEGSVRVFVALNNCPQLGDSSEERAVVDFRVPILPWDPVCNEIERLGCAIVASNRSEQMIFVRLPPPKRPYYCIKEYMLPIRANDSNEGLSVLIHEKRQRAVSSLQELVRHRSTGIDNTGDVCVWDAAVTLAWALVLHQQQHPKSTNFSDANPTTVLELGAGMAGLAGLSLFQMVQASATKPPVRLYITDGQISAVKNNRVHCRCMGFEEPSVHCQVLQWDTSPTNASLQSAYTLVADCTHFTEFHGHLFWTAVYHTAVEGVIWMCQPERTGTWKQFLHLVEAVNTAASSPLLSVQEKSFPALQRKHETFAQNSAYIPHLHLPRLFVLTKLRPEEESDRQVVLSHVNSR